ncbi:ABC transporter substrate-binding protein [Aidingimonas halophila]|uniref:Iron(III) transport system substrate-binding protein/two-component system, OmpR family, sensor histidine kinase TctE n=1 Tax=Aidingimonas halophila TaxID=574349 RepID=A0A1H2V507_9GAMM|nr:ABC transporter substrate-binding protein [Aidingimonas halophila]GHC23690.1 iron ABC transporter [Aidingimonas halophila]SDW62999.1 iron(III) transport system substrate-binding protein/two-component system, OmpR family, sensor histidine kinase TctE [Aidingimonas halophila]
MIARPLMILALAALALIATPAGARTELVVDAALDREVVEPLLRAFEQAHPDIMLDFRDSSTLEVDERVAEADPAPDVVISSAMPWQMSRVNEGFAQPLVSSEAQDWPAWAKWRDEVFGFTFEPIVMAYRLDLTSFMKPPATHADLHTLLTEQRDLLRGRVTTYSPSRSGVGYTLFQQDARYTTRFWDLVTAMGSADVSLEESTRDMLKGISEGRYWLGYNLLGSYAMVWAQDHPEVIVQVPQDYSLVMMRMAFIHRDAPNPAAARVFLDFLLSGDGQRVIAGETPLFSVRPDVVGPYTAQRLRDQVGDRLYPIPIDASLLAFVDPLRRKAFMERWRREFGQR